MSAQPITDEDAVAAADKEMEERANRAKQLLSQRYVGLKRAQVSLLRFALTHYSKMCVEDSAALEAMVLETSSRLFSLGFVAIILIFSSNAFLWIFMHLGCHRKRSMVGKCSWNAK